MNKDIVKAELERSLAKKVADDPKLHNVYLLVHSDQQQIHWPMAAGKTDDVEAHPEQPFHTASVGKTFTAVILAMLEEKGLLSFDDPIAAYLPNELLQDLHIYKGKDYSADIQIKHLLGNTSGIPDYFEEKPQHGKGLLEEILAEPSRFWTAEETINWSKKHLSPRFPPGKRVHYTDTGYNLLGLVIEAITLKPYHEVLHEYLFDPLQMEHSYLAHYSEPAVKSEYPVAQLYIDHLKIKVEEYRSFSSFYSGGQTVCTLGDLLRFKKALVHHRLIQKETLDRMMQWRKMWLGLDYGYGLMRLRFLPFRKKYICWGHLGASGSSMLYFPHMDIYVLGSFNQTTYQSKSMNYIFFNVLRKMNKAASKNSL